ncbi:MAG: Dam family site-specific DNA-(adenine-N6)-methyltransferase [Armatimonadota bacterium]|nr:Dam family site-specific DNA-(adenine-N6)-methyltransferase [Armatimonadota bacterium]
MGVASPFPYQGSKRQLADTILRYFPTDVERVIEPFAGSAAVALAGAANGLADKFWLNDIDRSVMSLWEEIVNAPEALLSEYAKLWHAQKGQEREFYDVVRDRFNRSRSPSDFLYLLARCVKASVRYNSDGEFNQSPDNRRKGAHPKRLRRRIMEASRLLAGRVKLTSCDYTEVLAEALRGDLVYMDPPYQGVSNGRDPRYRDTITFEAFLRALDSANERCISYILSYDGRTGSKQFGRPMPEVLGLLHIQIDAGRSSQATLLGRDANTVESLYLSPALVARIHSDLEKRHQTASPEQLRLLDLT